METRPTSLVEDTIAIESSSPVSNQLQATPSEAEVDAQLTQTTDVDGGGSHSVAPPLADANLDLSVIGTVVEPGPGALLLLPTHEPMSPISDLKLTTKAVPVGLTHPTAYMQDAQRGATGSSALATSDAAMAVAQPNYPPVIYPPVPVAALADSDRMQVDVQEDEMVGEDDEDMVDEEDASSEISEGEDLKVSRLEPPSPFSNSRALINMIMVLRAIWNWHYKAILTSAANTLSRLPYHKLPTPVSTSTASVLSECP